MSDGVVSHVVMPTLGLLPMMRDRWCRCRPPPRPSPTTPMRGARMVPATGEWLASLRDAAVATRRGAAEKVHFTYSTICWRASCLDEAMFLVASAVVRAARDQGWCLGARATQPSVRNVRRQFFF